MDPGDINEGMGNWESISQWTSRRKGCKEDTLASSGLLIKRRGAVFSGMHFVTMGTLTNFFCHDPPPKEYIDKGLRALHARVMKLFDTVEDKHHRCGVDNLYISAKFCKDAYQHPKCNLIYGVARKHGRGLPEFIIQDEKKRPNN